MSQPVKNVAIVGAGGHIGSYIANALVEQGKHTVTAITRPDSNSSLPKVHDVKKVDYNDQASLVDALKGQDFLVISMNVMAPKDSQTKLIDAAIEAGVRWIMPNEYGGNYNDKQFSKDTGLGEGILAIRSYIEEKGGDKTSWLSMSCGFWYEFSLSGAELRYGFDIPNRKLTMFDDGTVKHTVSTWPQVGRAMAELLALPESGEGLSLSNWKNKPVYIQSFGLSQKDMWASLQRVTGTKESDWTVTHESAEERYQRGRKMMQEGNFVGFGIMLYARVFFPDAKGDMSEYVDNEKLGLPEEDLDEATKVAVEYRESGRAKEWSFGM